MDTYFFNYNDAYNEAKKQNTFGIFNNLQICYYNGEINEQTPYQNLIPLPIDKICDYMMETPNRMIQNIKFDDNFNEDQQHQIASYIDQLQQIAAYKKTELGNQYRELIKNQVPDFNEPWRILFLTTRGTTVLQYVAKNLADAFNDLGYNTFISIEENAMQNWGGNDSPNNAYFAWHLKNIYEYNPHIIFNLDWINNTFLNDSVFNFVWFQDPMPVLYNNEKIVLRERDFIFYLFDEYKNALIDKKVCNTKLVYQTFCTNPKIFFENTSIQREEKIVFLGSDYDYYGYDITCGEYPNLSNMLQDMINLIEQGNLTLETIKELSSKYNIPYVWARNEIAGTLVRKEVVKWICKQNILPVEIYGTDDWLKIPEVAPYYKGLLPYGEKMAEVYNSAKYALVAGINSMYQQRLCEISACNTIPLVYHGFTQEEFLHFDNIVKFSTYKEMMQCIGKKPKKSPKQISEDISYEKMAIKIIDIVKQNV